MPLSARKAFLPFHWCLSTWDLGLERPHRRIGESPKGLEPEACIVKSLLGYVCVFPLVVESGGMRKPSEGYNVAPTGLQAGRSSYSLCTLSPGQKVNVPCRLLTPNPREKLSWAQTHTVYTGGGRHPVCIFFLAPLTLIPNSNPRFSSFALLLRTSASVYVCPLSHFTCRVTESLSSETQSVRQPAPSRAALTKHHFDPQGHPLTEL